MKFDGNYRALMIMDDFSLFKWTIFYFIFVTPWTLFILHKNDVFYGFFCYRVFFGYNVFYALRKLAKLSKMRNLKMIRNDHDDEFEK